ncbi:hypothetical protein FQA39_LY13028 [Lamprigera yunnana]|nr:hypothetical protein FQA39_LY13028 [Lamprigera yunnana]
MYQSPYMVQQITDIAGNKVFAPGVSFEIIIRSLGETGGKTITLSLMVFMGIINGFSGTLNPTLDPESQRVYGIAVFFGIFFTVLIIRSITLAFSWKSQVNQGKMQDIQLKAAEIKAKYKDKKDTQSKQKMSQETNALYKKEGISPFGALGGSFASLPFLFAIYTIIRSTRSLKIANIGEISLIKQP